MLDFSKLHDAIGKVADLAKSHAHVSTLLQDAKTEGQKLLNEALSAAQKEVDTLVEQLIAAVGTPAEANGLAAVAAALNVPPAPGVTVADPVAPAVRVDATGAPIAPAAPQAAVKPAVVTQVPAVTFLPGDPRAPK